MINISTTTTAVMKLAVNTPKYYNKFRDIQTLLIRISMPYIFIITCVGLITNSSTIVLLSKSSVTKNLRHKWTLIALALSDLLLNIALLIRVIHDIARGKIEYLCLFVSFLSQLAELLSACFIVLFTVQRFTAVRYPLQAAIQKWSSPFISLLVIFLASLLFCITSSLSNTHTDCHEELNLKWFIADALSSFIIPFSLILIFNILIINTIRKHARSPIIVQSTLSSVSADKRHKSGVNSKTNPFDEACSNGNSFTLIGTLSEIDNDAKSNLTHFSNKSGENKKISLTGNISNETSIPMLPIESVSQDEIPNNQSTHSSHQSLRGSKKKPKRKVSHVSNDVDFISNKVSQTTQSIHVTRMLVLVSTCFVILNAPAHLCVIALKIYTAVDAQVYVEHTEIDQFKQTINLTNNQLQNLVFIQSDTETKHSSSQDSEVIDDQIAIHLLYISVLITQLISYASYSVNFFLYSFSGVAFRTSLKQWFNKLRL